MKVRAIIFSLLLIGSILGVLSNQDQSVSAQILLVNDRPSYEDAPVPVEYEFEVKAGNYSVIGVRPEVGDDFDLEIYTDASYTTLIDNSTTVGDAVDFVVLDKDVWNSPPNRGARVTSGLGSYVIEMENEIDSHPVFDTWSGSMNVTSGNPVLDVGAPGSWDDTFAYFPSILYDGLIYHMWYSGFNGSNTRIGYANSTDGLTWKKYSGNPVLDLGSSGSWDDFHVHYPMILFNGTTYQMWYSGYDNLNYRIGYATSSDGLTWTKYGGNPVLNLGAPGSWEETYVAQASVLYEGAVYHMWYSGLDSFGVGRTGYATSSDGITWTRYSGNPVLDVGSFGSWDDFRAYVPRVISNGISYYMLYSGNDDLNYRLGYATSSDKINWTKSPANPILDLGPPGSWDSNSVSACAVLFNGTTYKIWYSGDDGTNNRIGYATLPDMDNWEKYSGNPVVDLGNPGDWDDVFVRSPAVIYDGTIYHMWYSGNSGTYWRIGYANSTDGINWTRYSGNPVLDLGVNWWEDEGVLEPFVLFDGIIYHMWYSGDDGTTTRRVCYANSTDGLNWNRYSGNPVLDVGSPGEWDDDSVYAEKVIFNGSAYNMWYTGRDPSSNRIGYATSPDGLSWTRYPGNPVMDLGPPGSWEDLHVSVPSIIYDGSTYQMWYGGGNGSLIRTGYATSVDGINWQRYSGNPVIETGSPGSFDDTYAMPTTVLYDGFTYHNWYTANDGSTYRIGYARITFKKLESIVEVLDAYEITGIIAGIPYNIVLEVPPPADLDMFIYNTTGGRDSALTSSTRIGAGINEYFTFTATTSGDYLLVVTNEDGGNGPYTISFDDEPPTITDVTAQPDPQEVYGRVRISAIITDNFQVGETWVEIYDPVGSFVGNFSMLYNSVNNRFYYEQNYGILGGYTFTISASDVVNHWASASGTFTIQDTTPPLISDVTEDLNPQEIFGNVNVSALITDNYQLFGAWIEIYDPDGDLIGNISMPIDPISGKYYFGQNYDVLGDHSYTIWANDTNDNWGSYSGTFVIQDTTPPLILDVTEDPNPQEVFGFVNVTANITDNYQLNNVWLEIRNPADDLVGNFSMSYDPVESRYYWYRSYDIIGTYTFTIQANDTSNNLASVIGSFLIQDTTPPMITDVTLEPDLPQVFEAQKLSANVTDNYQLHEVWIAIYDPNGDTIGNFSMVYDAIEGRYYLNHTYNISGEYTFTIWASDTSGNFASYSDTFNIEPEDEPDEYNWKPIIALVFALILLIIGILTVYNRPMKFTGILEKDRWYTLYAGVIPFIIAEAITGFISFFTGFLAVPPIIGLGMIVDLVILIAGIISCLVIYKKGVSLESYEEVRQPGPIKTPKIPYEPSQSHNGIIEPPEDPGISLPQPSEPPITPSPPFQYE